jgi:glucosamine-6-phosphate deaminase
VAFDEPGSDAGTGVREVRLHAATRADAAADFGGLAAVPARALTVGLRTILNLLRPAAKPSRRGSQRRKKGKSHA